MEEPWIERIDPPYWYNQLGSDTLQLLFYGNDMDQLIIKSLDSRVKIGTNHSKSKSYGLYNVILSDTIYGNISFQLEKGKSKREMSYVIRKKSSIEKNQSNTSSFKPSDAMYLLMPDRFKNADTSNDQIWGMREGKNKHDAFGRFGGDIKGIIQGLSHIRDLGFTSLWITPLWENDMDKQSYHGYACTDHYQIDRRYGTLQDYIELCKRGQEKGLKMVIDMVYNHVGVKHPLYVNPVDSQWFHHYTSKTLTNYRLATIPDPYALAEDRKRMEQGWFVPEMPDLNQSNKDVRRYLIQNTLWWLATANLNGVRVDTYPYSELEFLSELNIRLKKSFPDVFLFGETWETSVPTQVVYAQNIFDNLDSLSKPNSITDFQLGFALQKALNENWNWDAGLSRLYYTLSSDYLYKHPEKLVTFIDNHDMDRIHGQYNNELWKTQMGLGLLMMSRGIPCVFYGTEYLMDKVGAHGDIREPMPDFDMNDQYKGVKDSTKKQRGKKMIEWISELNKMRTNYYQEHFENGKRFQFVPTDGIYAAGIKYGNSVLIYAANQTEKTKSLEISAIESWLQKESQIREVFGKKVSNKGQIIGNSRSLMIEPQSFIVWEVSLE